jgi:hypothetical protein
VEAVPAAGARRHIPGSERSRTRPSLASPDKRPPSRRGERDRQVERAGAESQRCVLEEPVQGRSNPEAAIPFLPQPLQALQIQPSGLLLSVRKPYLGLAGRIAHAVFFGSFSVAASAQNRIFGSWGWTGRCSRCSSLFCWATEY